MADFDSGDEESGDEKEEVHHAMPRSALSSRSLEFELQNQKMSTGAPAEIPDENMPAAEVKELDFE